MMLRTVLLDLGGVFYQGDHLIPGALDALARLRASGLTLRFVTNTTRQSRTQLLRELAGRGLAIAVSKGHPARLCTGFRGWAGPCPALDRIDRNRTHLFRDRDRGPAGKPGLGHETRLRGGEP